MGTEPFSIRMDVRVYELDPQRHVAGPVYLRYADHSRFVCMQTAGISVEELLVPDPQGELRRRATRPALLGIRTD